MFRDKGRLDYEEVAGRAERANPELAKILKDAVAKHRELEKACGAYDYKGIHARWMRMSGVRSGAVTMRLRAGSGTSTQSLSA